MVQVNQFFSRYPLRHSIWALRSAQCRWRFALKHVCCEHDTHTPFAHVLHGGKSYGKLCQATPNDLENVRTQQLLTFLLIKITLDLTHLNSKRRPKSPWFIQGLFWPNFFVVCGGQILWQWCWVWYQGAVVQGVISLPFVMTHLCLFVTFSDFSATSSCP